MDVSPTPAAPADATPDGVPAAPRQRFLLFRFSRRFTLRTLMVLVTLLAVGFGYVGVQVRELKAEWEAEQRVLEYLKGSNSIGELRVVVAPGSPSLLFYVWPNKTVFYRVWRIAVETDYRHDATLVPRLRELRCLRRVDLAIAKPNVYRRDFAADRERIDSAEQDRRDEAAASEVEEARAYYRKLKREFEAALPAAQLSVWSSDGGSSKSVITHYMDYAEASASYPETKR